MGRDLAPLAAAGLIALGCAGSAPPPRLPGSVAAARLGPGTPAIRFRVLTEEGRGLDGPPDVLVAETPGELADLWDRYDLKGEPPPVDFAQDLVLAFAEAGFCNDGRLKGLRLTSAAELVPDVLYSGMVCDLISRGDCPVFVVRVAAVGRNAFPPGVYRLRWYGLATFAVRSPAPASAPSVPPPAPNTPPPPEPDAPAPRHPRHARIFEESGGADPFPTSPRSGVWVRSDAVWIPEPPWNARDPSLPVRAIPQERVCDRDACTRVLTRTTCHAPECPKTGILLFAERPLGVREPWPTEPAAWERLVGEIALDPALGVLLGGPQTFPRPPPPRPETIGWAQNRFDRSVELAASADYRRTAIDTFAGPGVRVGWHRNWPVQDTTTEGKLFEPLIGDGFGVDLRFGLLRGLEGDASGTGWRVGLGLSPSNAIGLSTSESRVRAASLLGLVLPEVGLVRLPGASVRFATTNALPIAFLLTRRLALELRPELSVLFGAGGPQANLSLSLGLMWRTRKSICPDPPFPSVEDSYACAARPPPR